MENTGRILIGLVLISAGIWFVFGDKLPGLQNLGRLPGDLQFGGENWKVYVPLGSSLLLSVGLSFLIWLLSKKS